MVFLLLSLLPYKARFLSEAWPNFLGHCALSAYPDLVHFSSHTIKRTYAQGVKRPKIIVCFLRVFKPHQWEVGLLSRTFGFSKLPKSVILNPGLHMRVTERDFRKYHCLSPTPPTRIFVLTWSPKLMIISLSTADNTTYNHDSLFGYLCIRHHAYKLLSL